MIGICRMKNTIQEYAWGSKTAIPELLGEPSPSRSPQAELWMGAHHKAPSLIIIGERTVSLLELIRQDPVSTLGKLVAEKFSGRLPFLFKVLAAGRPLSIQAHPNLKQAKEGFKRENEQGIPLDAFNRNYRDGNHKPEIISALTDFWALNGFRPLDTILELLGRMQCRSLKGEMKRLRTDAGDRGLQKFFHSLITRTDDDKSRLVDEAAAYAAAAFKKGDNNPVWKWILKLNKRYPGDIGVLCPVLLNLVCLKPGESMFLQAGKMHAYLEGAGIELMANSDNVLRGGLTPKHIDVRELLKILDFSGGKIELSPQENPVPGVKVYITPAEEFELTEITVASTQDYTSGRDRSIELMICVHGEAVVVDSEKKGELSIVRGTSIMIPASVKEYIIRGNARIYRASVPF